MNRVKKESWRRVFLTTSILMGVFAPYSVSRAQFEPNLPEIEVQSCQFEQLCSQQFTECEEIGKASYLTTNLIYQLFEAEKATDVRKRSEVIQEILQLYEAKQVDVVNKRLQLSDFLLTQKEKTLGGYATLIRSREIADKGKKSFTYIIAFKGTSVAIDDPNDILVDLFVTPVELRQEAAVRLHQGIRNYASSVFDAPKSQELLAEILSLQQQENTYVNVLVTGYSLGVSAVPYAAMLTDAGVMPSNLKVIVFGGSPMAQKSFISRYRALISRITRIETQGDSLIYEQDSPVKFIYDSLGYVPFGNLLKAESTPRLINLKQQRIDLERRMQTDSSLELKKQYLVILQQILQEQIAIHKYSYRYYYQYYNDLVGNSLF